MSARTVGAGPSAWEIPAAELATQRLFRVRYDGPEGEVSLRVTLWLATADRYRVAAADALGRAVWTLAIEGGEGLWLDHRNDGYCRVRGAIDLASVPLSPFRFTALPALLLGRVPEPPGVGASSGAGAASEERQEYRDAEGKRWSFQQEGGRILTWTVWQEGAPVAWWNGRGEEAILSQRRDGVQVRWRQVVREPMAEMPPIPAIPESYFPACSEEDRAGGGP